MSIHPVNGTALICFLQLVSSFYAEFGPCSNAQAYGQRGRVDPDLCEQAQAGLEPAVGP
jgi:hypothetical protein